MNAIIDTYTCPSCRLATPIAAPCARCGNTSHPAAVQLCDGWWLGLLPLAGCMAWVFAFAGIGGLIGMVLL